MEKVRRLLRNLFPGKWGRGGYDADALRVAFRDRYHQFKLLLNANNKALALMAEISEILNGVSPFGMTFVRSRSTALTTNVFQIIRNLNALAPGKYESLLPPFREIQKVISGHIKPRPLCAEGPPVIPLSEVDSSMADLVGSKLANLGELGKKMPVLVPRGFAITSVAYEIFMRENELQTEIDRLMQSERLDSLERLYAVSGAIQQKIIGAAIPGRVEREIREQYLLLRENAGERITVAIRSSALGEDSPGASFAGQYRSELNVHGENILQAYKEILASKYSLPAMTYRLNRGIRDDEVAMCVGCMEMVDAVAGGVAYSRNPLDIRDDAVVINSVWGHPKSVVDGSTACDLFEIQRGAWRIRRKEVGRKDRKLVCYPEEGLCRVELSADQSREPSLTDAQALEIGRLMEEIENYYRRPQDVEWALSQNGSLFLLQCRPLQQREASEERPEREFSDRRARALLKGGITVSPGVSSGAVYILQKDVDALRCPEGAVLVTSQALARWAALLNRAAAVIADHGSVTGHLANICREFRVPALFGVEEASNRLKDGMVVTVDADGRTVYEGLREEILSVKEQTPNPMEGSPVHQTLKTIADLVLPLNLLDPDAPGFKPENCRTLHDITRYCHEKAVQEMFRFGKDHHFPERSSKQLLCGVPMKWWILNLDDGFREEVEGKYVSIENIVSVPMLSIWEGIAAMPWEGPPPVDGRGMMSVLFEATRNTALVPAMRSSYGDRNYFMISKNYCSLSSRLGFHFSLIEAMVSERASENYVSFQYKGGAADMERRTRRVFFIGEILEEYGFRVEAKEDTLLARLGEREMEYIEDRLRILGFLTIHTRQLDMIMSNPDSLQYYRAKLKRDIREKILR